MSPQKWWRVRAAGRELSESPKWWPKPARVRKWPGVPGSVGALPAAPWRCRQNHLIPRWRVQLGSALAAERPASVRVRVGVGVVAWPVALAAHWPAWRWPALGGRRRGLLQHPAHRGPHPGLFFGVRTTPRLQRQNQSRKHAHTKKILRGLHGPFLRQIRAGRNRFPHLGSRLNPASIGGRSQPPPASRQRIAQHGLDNDAPHFGATDFDPLAGIQHVARAQPPERLFPDQDRPRAREPHPHLAAGDRVGVLHPADRWLAARSR